MEDKKWIIGLIILIAAIVFIGTLGFKKNEKNVESNQSNQEQQQPAAYFAEDATVMFFYSDTCSYCVKQKKVLEQLAPEGYRVKPMDVAKNPNYWKDYQVEGTPTFIDKKGEKLIGYHEYDQLKKWLDEHK